MPVFFVAVGAVMIGIGVRQLQVGNERIVGKRFEFEDFAVHGARWTVEGLCAGFAAAEIGGGLLAVLMQLLGAAG